MIRRRASLVATLWLAFSTAPSLAQIPATPAPQPTPRPVYTKQLPPIDLKSGDNPFATYVGNLEYQILHQHKLVVPLSADWLLLQFIVHEASHRLALLAVAKHADVENLYDAFCEAILNRAALIHHARGKTFETITDYGIVPSRLFNPRVSWEEAWSRLPGELDSAQPDIKALLLQIQQQTKGGTQEGQALKDSLASLEKQLLSIITKTLGTPLPIAFKLQGNDLTPASFADAYNLKNPQRKYYRLQQGVLSFELAVAKIRQEIDQGRSVVIHYYHADPDKEKNGFLTLTDAAKESIQSQTAVPGLKLSANHTEQIVGYILGLNGKVVLWKIQHNSGKTVGDSGFFHMTSKYFQAGVVEFEILN